TTKFESATKLNAAGVSTAVPLLPSLVAVMVALPAARPVTSPVAETVATDPLLLAQVTTRPVSTLPPASLRVAANCVVPPTVTLAAAGLTVTDATGTVVTVRPADLLTAVPVIVTSAFDE